MRFPDTRQTVIGGLAIVAAGGAVASFQHVYGFAQHAGQPVASAILYPALTDVLVASSTACLLYAARQHRKATFAKWAFALGVAATLGANAGDYFRVIPAAAGMLVSAWPAVAFVCAVLLAHWFNKGPQQAGEEDVPYDIPETSIPEADLAELAALDTAPAALTAPDTALSKTERAEAALNAARAAGESLSAADLARRAKVSDSLARQVVRAASNGHS